MRAILSALIFAALVAPAAAATVNWTSPGWYQIEDVDIDGWIYAGPFSTEADCKSSLPADDDEAMYYCEYLATKPAWDY
jgi:hypothetical protein